MSRTIALVCALVLSAPHVSAQIVVSNTNDSGAGSLRAAINSANANGGADTIVVQAGLSGTINLSSSLPAITGPLTINGDSDGNPCTKEITISGGDAFRILAINDVSVTIRDLTLRDGSAGSNGEGGAIEVSASSFTPLLTLDRVSFISNQAGDGGAIEMNGGALAAVDCVFDQNTTLNGNQGEFGGAIRFDSVLGGSVTLGFTRCTFSGNTSQAEGGAVAFETDANATYGFTACHFTGNRSTTFEGGGAIAVRQQNTSAQGNVTVNVTRCQFDGNMAQNSGSGGAIRIETGGSPNTTLLVEGTTFHTNSAAANAGAIRVLGGNAPASSVTLRNTTMSGNSCGSGSGQSLVGGMDVTGVGQTLLDSCTVVDNTGRGTNSFGVGVVGGIDVFNGSLTVRNSIFAGNSGVAGGDDADELRRSGSGSFTDGQRNLVQGLSFITGGGLGGNNITGTAPGLAALGDAPVIVGALQADRLMEVRAPNAGSIVLNNGATPLSSDQVGNARPAGGTDDIGAIEGTNLPLYQLNQPAASFDIDGIQGSAVSPATVTGPTTATHVIDASTTMPGMPYDIAVWGGAPVAAGLPTPEGQFIHADFCFPGIAYLIGQTTPNTTIPFNATLPYPVSFQTGPVDVSAQMFIVDPTRPDGVSLSQPVRLITQ